MPPRTTTVEDLIDFQNAWVEVVKKNLLEHGEQKPMLFVLTTYAALTPDVHKTLEGAGLTSIPLDAPGDEKPDLAAVVFPMDMSPRTIFSQLMLIPGKHGQVLQALVALAQQQGVDDPYLRVIRPFLAVQRIGEKDVHAKFMQCIVKLLGAYAYLKVDESWFVKPEVEKKAGEKFLSEREAMKARKKMAADLADEPEAGEAAMLNLESAGFQRMVMVPFTRTVRGTGRVTGFGEPWILDSRDENQRIRGRFRGLLTPLPGALAN